MQETVFHLTSRPFSVDIRVERYFPGESIEAARVAIARTIERAEGSSLIVGPPGSGKTMLCHVLAEQFRGQLASVILSGGRLPSRKSLLQAILYELGLPYRRMDEGELRLALIDHLAPRDDGMQGMLLLVDEAHTLSPKLLEELRLLTNLVRQGSPRVRLVLAGGAVLEERFASPKLAAFNQRLTARGYLEPFSSEETQQFIRAQLAAAGGQPDLIFTEKALRAIHRTTDGVARLVNQLCDHVLLLASAGTPSGNEASPIDEQGVEEAWADLQQLPMPWNTDSAPEGPLGGETPTTVDFASVDDDLDDFEDSGSDGGGFEDEDGGQDSDRAQTVPFQPAEAAMSDPTDQLDSIQDQLDNVEEDFQPAGSIGPKVELAFEKVDDPFGDKYRQDNEVSVASEEVGVADEADEFDDDLGTPIDAPSKSRSDVLSPEGAAVEPEPEMDYDANRPSGNVEPGPEWEAVTELPRPAAMQETASVDVSHEPAATAFESQSAVEEKGEGQEEFVFDPATDPVYPPAASMPGRALPLASGPVAAIDSDIATPSEVKLPAVELPPQESLPSQSPPLSKPPLLEPSLQKVPSQELPSSPVPTPPPLKSRDSKDRQPTGTRRYGQLFSGLRKEGR